LLDQHFIKSISDHIRLIVEEETPQIRKAAAWIADSIAEDKLLHLFGCGHSHILVEDVFYRAGGLVPVNALFESSIMLHEGAVKSSRIEQMEGYARHILDNYIVYPDEIMIIISNSGINGLPVDMALEAKARGLKVVALTSSAYFNDESRHSSGKKLCDIADLVIDNHLPHGDALVEVPSLKMSIVSGSTIIGSLILNMLVTMIIENLLDRGIVPPIYTSGNVSEGHERNKRFIELYRRRIKNL
jgi:uncharacterized phosphosugar-binding protein